MFHGCLTAIVTPMHQDGSIDYLSFEKLIAWQCQEQIDGIVILGTTGESATVEKNERTEIIRSVVNWVKGKVPIIVGTGSNSTAHAIELTKHAMEMGADAALIVTPYYNKPTQQGLFLHYRAIAQSVPIPQILYNVPGRTACDLLPTTIARLSSFPNIIGVKEATGDLSRLPVLKQSCPEMDLLSGDDFTAMEFMLQGGKGVISVASNIAPAMMCALCHAALHGDRQTALQYNQRVEKLYNALFIESNPIPSKWALSKMGFIEPGIRLPLTVLSDENQSIVQAALDSLKERK